jgi:hypothetical protein
VARYHSTLQHNIAHCHTYQGEQGEGLCDLIKRRNIHTHTHTHTYTHTHTHTPRTHVHAPGEGKLHRHNPRARHYSTRRRLKEADVGRKVRESREQRAESKERGRGQRRTWNRRMRGICMLGKRRRASCNIRERTWGRGEPT